MYQTARWLYFLGRRNNPQCRVPYLVYGFTPKLITTSCATRVVPIVNSSLRDTHSPPLTLGYVCISFRMSHGTHCTTSILCPHTSAQVTRLYERGDRYVVLVMSTRLSSTKPSLRSTEICIPAMLLLCRVRWAILLRGFGISLLEEIAWFIVVVEGSLMELVHCNG